MWNRFGILPWIIVLILMAGFVLYLTPQFAGPPRLELDVHEIDFGVIPTSGPAEKLIPVFNRGKGILSIKGVSTSCGCVRASIEPKTIWPGRKGMLRLTTDPAEMIGFESHKTMDIHSNDPGQPHYAVPVHARVNPEFVLDPPRLDLGMIQKGKEARGNFRLRQAGSVSIQLLDVNKKNMREPDSFEVAFTEVPQDKWHVPHQAEYTVDVLVKSNVSTGPFKEMLSLKTTCARVPAISYEIRGEVVAPYTLQGTSSRTPTVCGDTISNAARIAAPIPFTLTDLHADSEYISVQWVAQKEPNTFELEMKVNPDAPKGAHKFKIVFAVHVGANTYQDSVTIERFLLSAPVSGSSR